MALRIKYAANPNPQDEDAEHGRRHPDEVAALISLVLGIRIQAGGVTQYFDFWKKGKPLGKVSTKAEVETPVLLPGAWTQIVAHARRTADLDELDLLDTYPDLPDAADATRLMRAAALVPGGTMAFGARETWLTWLLLVSAVETAANSHKCATETSPSELLRELDPRLAKVAEKHGDAYVKEVAETQMRLLGATEKFLGFLEAFMPQVPEVRPPEYRLDWTRQSLSAPLRQIYRLRSEYLHAGVPFPLAVAQRARAAHEGVPTERHPDHVEEAESHDGKRVSDPDLPMHVHVFEHITRGALLRWWKGLVPSAPTSPSTPD